MQFRVFAIPAAGSPEMEEEMNRFLRSHRVVSVQKSLEISEGRPLWCFCVEYLQGQPPVSGGKGGRSSPVDYKDVLSEADFAVFTRIRKLRKELAAAEGTALYNVCTNEQIAEMARKRPATIADLREIPRFGEAKAEKYGAALLAAVADPDSNPAPQEDSHAPGGKPD